MEANLDREMQMAWAEKHKQAEDTLAHARKAPALFKPLYVTQLKAEVKSAENNYRIWL